jgi:hypothetical protein
VKTTTPSLSKKKKNTKKYVLEEEKNELFEGFLHKLSSNIFIVEKLNFVSN